jgi:uroporphyrin-3 C-methyltransferase
MTHSNNPEVLATGAAAAVPPRTERKRSGTIGWLALLLSALALGGAGYQWWQTQRINESLRFELGQRLASADQAAQQSRKLAEDARHSLSALQTRLAGLEAKLAESQTQQVALESLYQTLLRNQGDWSLAEVEQIVNIAAQQLQLAGNIKAAIVALEVGDARLGRMNDPQLASLRTVLQQDLERLKAVPLVDTQGISLRLERISALADTLPLAYLARPTAASAANSATAASAANSASAASAANVSNAALPASSSAAAPAAKATASPATPAPAQESRWRRAWMEFKDLVRVQHLEQPAPALLSPEQSYFLRENLKLRLQGARFALASHENAGFQADLREAQAWLQRYFDQSAPATRSAMQTIEKLLASSLDVAAPSIQTSLTAIHDLRIAREKAAAQ